MLLFKIKRYICRRQLKEAFVMKAIEETAKGKNAFCYCR